MKNEFVPYEQSLELKELGFDEPCIGNYYHTKELKIYGGDLLKIKNSDMGTVTAPLFRQVFKWFREKFELHSFIDCKWKNLGWEYELVDLNKMEKISCIGNYGYKTPEEAELECLIKLIEIAKKGPDWDRLKDFPNDEL
jgi:hypothetical protein